MKNVGMFSMIGVFMIMTSFFLYDWLNPAFEKYPQAYGGQLNASMWDFTTRGIIPLRGEWEFYEGQLLGSQDFLDHPQLVAGRQLVRVPGNWKGIVDSGGRDGYGAGTYRLIVQVDKKDLYGFIGKKIRMSSRVIINGADVGGNGRPTVTEQGFVPSNLPFLGMAQAEAGAVEIIVQVSSFKYLEGGLVQAPEFGLAKDIVARQDCARLVDMILITTMLVFGLYYIGMFKRWRKEPHLVHFSIFCLTLGLFYSFDDEILAATVVPSLSFLWLQKMIILLPLTSFYFFYLYVHRFLGGRDNGVFYALRWIFIVFFAVFLFTPNEYFLEILWTTLALEALILLFVFLATFCGRSRGVQGTGSILLGVFFLLFIWIYAQLRYHLAMDNPNYMIVTPLLLLFSQAYLMSERIQEAFHKSESLARQLLIYDQQKDEFLAKTSHELRTPLHGIINLSQLLLEDLERPLQPEHRENVRLLHLVGRRLAGLVHDILDMNRIKLGQLHIQTTQVDVHMSVFFVLETLSITSINRKVRLINELPATLPLVEADENRLRQILHNLLENALKYTERGTVRISAEVLGDELAITIADTGPGIPRDRLTSIFEPFVQQEEKDHRPQGGMGLGLSISKQLVDLQGGNLEVESEVGQGSRFTFTMPIALQVLESAAADDVEPQMAEQITLNMRGQDETAEYDILIVDDESSNLKVLIDAVTSLHYAYTAVESGQEALALLKGRKLPDLVLLDLMMPGLSGLDVCRKIRSMHDLAELPVLMLTASGQVSDMTASFHAGANDILQKPFELVELKARMQSLLSMKRSSERAVKREMDFLQTQITPHFLYNSLNTLVGLSYKDVDRLRDTIHHLTTYLRAKFTFVFQAERISFEQELELVRAYLAIEQLRFGSRLHVRYLIEEDLHFRLPPLMLQPLVENAVRHGIGPKPPGGTVEIIAARSGEGVLITVRDNGIGMEETKRVQLEQAQSHGVGIAPSV